MVFLEMRRGKDGGVGVVFEFRAIDHSGVGSEIKTDRPKFGTCIDSAREEYIFGFQIGHEFLLKGKERGLGVDFVCKDDR